MGLAEEVENKVCAFPVLIAGNGGIISKDGDPIGMGIPVDVVEVTLNPKHSGGRGFDGNGGDGTVRDTVSDRGEPIIGSRERGCTGMRRDAIGNYRKRKGNFRGILCGAK